MKGLLFTYLVTAFGVVGGLANPVIGLFTYVLFATLRPQFVWGFAGDFGGISQYVAIAMFIGWARTNFGQYGLRRVMYITAPLAVFGLWVFVSAQTATNTTVANAWAIEFLKILAPFLVGVTTLNTTKQARLLLWVLVASHAYVSLNFNQGYFLTGFNEVGELGFGGADNNSYAVSLVTALGPAIGLALSARSALEKAVAGLSIVLILHTILLTYSRGGMTGLIVSLIVIFAMVPKKPSYVAAVFVVFLIGARLAGPQVIERFSTSFASQEERDASADSRFQLWAACWQMATRSPLVGVGPRNFPVNASAYGFTAGKEAHSTWMQTLAEMGFPGLLALLAFYAAAVRKLWPIARRKWTPETKEETVLAAGILSGLAGFMVSAQFVTTVGMETSYYTVMVGAILAASASQKVLGTVSAPAAVPYAPAPVPARAVAANASRRAGAASPPRRRRFQWNAVHPPERETRARG